MRVFAFVLLFVFCYVECRKTYAPIDKNANLAFINMESGGVRHPPNNVGPPSFPTPAPKGSTPPPNPKPVVPEPVKPAPQPVLPTKPPSQIPQKPVYSMPTPKPVHPANPPNQIPPKQVYPTPAPKPIPTPGPGSVKQLVTFYDSQGKASPIRPYSYSQAVKQG